MSREAQRKKDENQERMRNHRCIRLKREILTHTAPKKCAIIIKLSDKVSDDRFVENIFNEFYEKASTPFSISKIRDKEYEVIVGSDFKRCSECSSLRGRYREFLDGNVIDDKGNCTFEGRKKFSDEDYFD